MSYLLPESFMNNFIIAEEKKEENKGNNFYHYLSIHTICILFESESKHNLLRLESNLF